MALTYTTQYKHYQHLTYRHEKLCMLPKWKLVPLIPSDDAPYQTNMARLV